jgi:Asp-tRNA(Asn)/Glu-tRNA(Gln) amidotransferase C subunit
MKEQLRKLDAEYGFKLTDAEIERIARDAKETESLFQQINQVDVSGKAPLMKLPLKRAES